VPTDTATGAAPPDRERRRAALLATAVAVPVTLVLLLIVLLARPDGGPAAAPLPTGAPPTAAALPPVTVPAPAPLGAAAQRSCQELIAALPTELGDLPARPVDSPSPYVVAWGEPVVTLRCGVARPPTLIRTAEVTILNGVTWLPERRGDRTAWIAVDRPVYVEVVAPVDAVSGPAARLSTPVTAALPKRPLDPAD
jgi:hypothetical protein